MESIDKVNNSKGFTLIEIIITLAIIAVLAAIAIPQFTKYLKLAHDAELVSDTKNAYTASQSWLSDNPGGTLDSMSKLISGGYKSSSNVLWGSGSMTDISGTIILVSSAADDTKNVSTILYNGNIKIGP